MSKSVEETRRELFENKMMIAFKKENCGDLHTAFNRDADGRYYRNYVHSAWLAFSAALDSVEIKFPPQDISHYGGPDSVYGPSYEQVEGAGYNHGLSDCRLAIEATNLGLKIK